MCLQVSCIVVCLRGLNKFPRHPITSYLQSTMPYSTGWSLSKAVVQETHLHFKQANNNNETRTGGGGCFDVLNVTEKGFSLNSLWPPNLLF